METVFPEDRLVRLAEEERKVFAAILKRTAARMKELGLAADPAEARTVFDAVLGTGCAKPVMEVVEAELSGRIKAMDQRAARALTDLVRSHAATWCAGYGRTVADRAAKALTDLCVLRRQNEWSKTWIEDRRK